jgi:thiosulfate dehydrogenase [quinone] large subunit
MNSIPSLRSSDASLAHALARLGLGISIATHGLSRIGDIRGFSASLEKMFAATWLPAFTVRATACAIPPLELGLGLLLMLGLFLRPALVVGLLLLCQLTFGSTLTQQWEVASEQMIYIAFYAVLLATAGFDRYSLDAWLRHR